MSRRSSESRWRLDPAFIVILAGVCAALHVAKLSPALPVLRGSLAISLLQAGFLLSLVQLAGMLLGLAVGVLADGWGFRRSILTGLGILVIASGLGGFARNLSLLLVLRAAEGFGFLLVTLSVPGMIRHLVPAERLSRLMGFWGAYMPLGTAAALLSGPWVISRFDWPIWWWVLSALTFGVAIWVWKATASDHGDMIAVTTRSEQASWRWRMRQTLSSVAPWLLAVCFFMYSGQWLAVIGFLPVIYSQAGYEGGVTAGLTGLVAAVNMIGNILSGQLLSRKVRPAVLLYIGFAVMAAGSTLAFADCVLVCADAGFSAVLRYSGVLLFSMVGGLIPGTLFSLAAQLASGQRVISTTMGWMQQWSAFGQFSGPPLVAWVASHYGGWQMTWVVTGSCSLAGMALTLLINRKLRV